jgi:hypothetical protein
MSTATPTPKDVAGKEALPVEPYTTPPLWWQNDIPHKQSRAAADIAAGKVPLPESDPLAAAPHSGPEEFPKALYNKEKRVTKTAKDKDEEKKLTGEGFSEEPYPAEDPDALTAADVQALQSLLAKAGQAVQKIAAAVEKQEREKSDKPAAHQQQPKK